MKNLYESIKKVPFKIPEDGDNDLTATFYNPDKEGWLLKQGMDSNWLASVIYLELCHYCAVNCNNKYKIITQAILSCYKIIGCIIMLDPRRLVAF